MPVKKISVSVNAETLREIRELAGDAVNLSALVDEGLTRELYRRRMLALLDEMDLEDPIPDVERREGAKLWRQIESSSIPARSQRSRKKVARSA
jgi:hypothetical protein